MSKNFISVPYSSILNAFPQAAFVVGPDFAVEEANSIAIKFFGLDSHWQGNALNRFLSLPAEFEQSVLLDVASNTRQAPFKALARLPSGDSVCVDVYFSPFPDGVFLVVMNPSAEAVQEVSGNSGADQTQIDERLDSDDIQKAVEALKEKVADLELVNCQLQDAVDQRSRSLNSRSQFISLVSHQLRTPLSALVGLTELLQVSGPLTEEQEQLTSSVTEAANALLTRLNILVEWSELEAGRLKVESRVFEPASVVHECVNACFNAARSKRISLVCSVEHVTSKVIGDDQRILRILNILVETIIGFTTGGEISVSCSLEPRSPETVLTTFFVRGPQPALADEAVQNLFQKPVSEDGWIGISLGKGLVELMGGNISANRLNDGAVVYSISLPLAAPQDIEPQRSDIGDSSGPDAALRALEDNQGSGPANGSSAARKRILVVEDNPILQKVVAKQLSSFGFDVHAVSTGLQAIETYKVRRFDLILMDCLLPEMDGFDATLIIREEEKKLGYRTPIIAMTAGLARGDKERCINAGMDDYLRKPVGLETIRQKILQWCVKKRI